MTTTTQLLPPPQPNHYVTLHNQHGNRYLLSRRNYSARARLLSRYVSEHEIDYTDEDDWEDYADYGDFLLTMLGAQIPALDPEVDTWYWASPAEFADYFGRFLDHTGA